MKLVNQTKNEQSNVSNANSASHAVSRTQAKLSATWLKICQGVCSAAVFSFCVGATSTSVVFANDQLTERPSVLFTSQTASELADTSMIDNNTLNEALNALDNSQWSQPDAGTEMSESQEQAQSEPMVQKVNINLANFEQLVALPGIGKVKANAILTYRKEVGVFNSVADIQNIKGIGVKLFAKLSNLIEV